MNRGPRLFSFFGVWTVLDDRTNTRAKFGLCPLSLWFTVDQNNGDFLNMYVKYEKMT